MEQESKIYYRDELEDISMKGLQSRHSSQLMRGPRHGIEDIFVLLNILEQTRDLSVSKRISAAIAMSEPVL